MKLNTLRFGELEIDPQSVVFFEDGIPGFERMKNFVLVYVKEHAPFSYLQSMEDGELAFVLADPFEFVADYEFILSDQAKEKLQVCKPEEVMVRSIVSIRGGLETASLNLVAPVVINPDKRIGKQVILTNTEYTTHYRLFKSDE